MWDIAASEELRQAAGKPQDAAAAAAGILSRKRVLLRQLKLCSSTRNLQRGKKLHGEAVEAGDDSCVYVATALVNMYAKCGRMDDARLVFDSVQHPDVVAWNALLLGYARNGQGTTGLDLFARMVSQGCQPNCTTFTHALLACTSLALEQDGRRRPEVLERGMEIHSQVGSNMDIYVQNTLIDVYAKCGSMVHARQVFESMRYRDVVSWNALILGYAENGEGVTALKMFSVMKRQGCAPDFLTFHAALKACGSVGALECGSRIHARLSTGAEPAGILVTSLVDFYAKCGDLVQAQEVFDAHPRTRDLATWTALLEGYSHLGDDEAAFGLFQRMQDAGFRPDGVTFLCILLCCSHAGLTEKAREFFEAMPRTYGIPPAVEHCTCMLDILGRSNKLDDAMALLRGMPFRPDAVSWMIVLAACRKWKNVTVGTLAFKSGVALEDNAAAYVLMATIFKSRGMWREGEMVLAMKEDLRAWKEPGKACWTNEEGQVHAFCIRDGR